MQALLSETESSKNEPRNSNQNWYYQISPNRGKIKHQILDSNQKSYPSETAMPLMKFELVTIGHDLITHRQYNLRKILPEGPKLQRQSTHKIQMPFFISKR